MKKSNRTKEHYLFICIVLCAFAIASCKSPTEEKTESNAVTDPVGVILPPTNEAPGMKIAVLAVPRADDKVVAENISVAFHKARAKCTDVLVPDPEKAYTLNGLTIFDGKISISEATAEDNPVLNCIKNGLKNQPLPGFKDQTHVLEIQFAIEDKAK